MLTEDDIPRLIAEMTLDEKCSLLSGSGYWHTQPIERLGIPALMMADGPHGLRTQVETADMTGGSLPATCFPPAVTLASSWDKELLEEVGQAIADEARAQGVGVVLGPGVNLKRSPLCGRNFEYFSEDPFLAADLAAAMVDGLQSSGIGASLKHFAVNNQETDRMRVDARVDERTLRELYLSVFERVIRKAQPETVMCAYNRINGEHASQHRQLLTEILRDDWGFEGAVVSDWGAVDNRPKGVAAGLDLEMPASGGVRDRDVVRAVVEGDLDELEVDRCVERVLRLVARSHAVAPTRASLDVDGHDELAAEAATRGAVLLKNDDALPLDDLADVVVVGELARTPRQQGAGSSKVNPTRVTSPLDALGARRDDLPFAPGYVLAGSPTADADDESLRAEARSLADGKIALVFVGLPAEEESEGLDRTHICMPESHRRLIAELREVARSIVVVLANGAVVETSSWDAHADAILEMWLGGQASGEAVARLVTGEAAPSGRLAETIPVSLSQHPAQLNFPGDASVVHYGEGLFIGHRAFDHLGLEPAYPFGHGLTYTTFEYRDLEVDASPITDDIGMDDVVVTVRCVVANTGERAAAAVPQLYVGRPASTISRPPRELRGFERIELEPGASATVEFRITRRDIAHWDIGLHGWAVEPGPLTVWVGASSRDLPLEATIDLDAPRVRPPLDGWSTLAEWREVPEAWQQLLPHLGALSAVEAAEHDPADLYFLWSMPVNKVRFWGAPELTAERIEEILAAR